MPAGAAAAALLFAASVLGYLGAALLWLLDADGWTLVAVGAAYGVLLGMAGGWAGTRQRRRERGLIASMAAPAGLEVPEGGSSEDAARAVADAAAELSGELERALAEREQFEGALAATGDIVLAVGADARIAYANPAARTVLGEGAREGAPLIDAVSDPELLTAVVRALAEPAAASLNVMHDSRHYQAVIAPLGGDGGWRLAASLRDLSDRHEAEAARRDFFVNASHELRTPLATIAAAAETLELAEKPEDVAKFGRMIQAETDRMGQLVEEMLALARLESGLTEPEISEARADGLLERAASAIAAQAQRAGVSLSWSGTDAAVLADPGLVERALQNLLHNAVKFTPAGGSVEAYTEAGEEPGSGAPMLWFRVRDTGAGVEPADRTRIFQRFYRADGARTRDGEAPLRAAGTGLGLAVVRHIAEVHGGAVSLESQVGRGSTFGFSVPLAPVREAAEGAG